jgi:predicted nucleotidyltransferase
VRRRVQGVSRDPRAALADLRNLASAGELDAFCAAHGIRLLVAFGSAVQPDASEPRDLDVAVLLQPGADLVAVVTALVALLSCDEVDVMDLAAADLVARGAALAGEPLFEDEPGLYARRQMATLPLLVETAWIRRLQLEQLAS